MAEEKRVGVDGPEFNYDSHTVHRLAHAKRFLELWSMMPGFRDKNETELKTAIREYGLDITTEEARYLYDIDFITKQTEKGNEAPETVLKYRKFCSDKLAGRNYLQLSGCAPSDKKFAKWRLRQVNRCWIELGGRNAAMIHSPLLFELSDGCSVGCPFCGVSADKFRGYYKNTPGNMRFWREILQRAKNEIGDAAGTGTCYYATEPFDNPDYESFSRVYHEVTGRVPQVTSAAAMRNPERTRQFLESVRNYDFHIHRFSVLSLEILGRIFAGFTPEELLYVELLPQFSGAPSNRFSRTGRQFLQNTDITNNSNDTDDFSNGETICCISGFVVNMCRKRIRLITPGITDREHPTGELVIGERFFNDAESFSRRLRSMIDEYMDIRLRTGNPLRIKQGITYEPDSKTFKSGNGPGFALNRESLSDPDGLLPVYEAVGRLLMTGPYSADQIVEKLFSDTLRPEQIYYVVNKLYDSALLAEV
jgi:radical SAM family RiPP maturation amino acid epimerase